MSNLYTKETLTQALEWLAARKDVVTGTDIDRYVQTLPTVVHGVPSRDLWNAAEIVLDALKRRCAGYPLDYENETARIENLENVLAELNPSLLTSHRAPSDDGVREAVEAIRKIHEWTNVMMPSIHAESERALMALAALTKEKS